jgi:hypothetical protein
LQGQYKPWPGDKPRQKESETVIGTDSLLVFVPGPEAPQSLRAGASQQGKGGALHDLSNSNSPKLRLVRPALEIAQPIVPASPQSGGVRGVRAKESYSDEILRMALDRMISHAAHELLDDATRPFFEPATEAGAACGEGPQQTGESAVHAVIEPKNCKRGGRAATHPEAEPRNHLTSDAQAMSPLLR